MAQPPVRKCGHPGCRELVRSSRCSQHKKERKQSDRNRPNAYQRGYTKRWQKASRYYLDKHPLCVECSARGKVVEATCVDHIRPHRGDMVAFWDRDNWQGLCASCHSRKTRRGE